MTIVEQKHKIQVTIERPTRIEINEVQESIDEDEHEQTEAGDNKVVIIENIVIILEVSPAHKKIAYDDPKSHQKIIWKT